MAIVPFTELITIGLTLPFLSVLLNPEILFESKELGWILKQTGISNSNQLPLFVTILFISAALVSGVLRLCLLTSQTRFSFGLGSDLSCQLYRIALHQKYYVHISQNSSDLIANITNKTYSVTHYIVLPLLLLISSSIILFVVFLCLILVSPVAAISIIFLSILFYGLVIFFTKKKLSHESREISKESSRVIKILQEGIGGFRDVILDGTQNTFCRIYETSDKRLRKSQANIQIISQAPRFIIESLGIILIAISAYLFTNQKNGFAEAIPLFGAMALGAQRLLPVLQQLYSSWSLIRGSESSLNDVISAIGSPVCVDTENLSLEDVVFREKLKINNVSFAYNNNGSEVLNSIDLVIPKGSCVGIIGQTGCGKSTLIDMIMGLIQPNRGEIFVDEICITDKNSGAWQKQIAHVPQAIFLADASISENIAFGIPIEQIDYDRVKQVCEIAQIAQTIELWPKKYLTLVGERGVKLSGGQRQRIGIARALYKNCDFIVLDEATSALDNDTEILVMNEIRQFKKNLTLLIVTHRLNTLENCSQIIELKQGKLTRVGTYAEIILRK